MTETSQYFIVAVAAIIMKGDRILAMQRSTGKDAGPGLWETLSGRVRHGESPLDAVVREIDEECGLSVAVDPRPITAYEARRNHDPMIVIIYRADYLSGAVRRSEEHDRHAWLTPAEFAGICRLPKLVEAVMAIA